MGLKEQMKAVYGTEDVIRVVVHGEPSKRNNQEPAADADPAAERS